MTAENSIEIRDKPDSVTLKRNAKGDLAWDIKCYFATSTTPEMKVDKVDALQRIAEARWGVQTKE